MIKVSYSEPGYCETVKEELFIKNPRDPLLGCFKQEGAELVYVVEDKGYGHLLLT